MDKRFVELLAKHLNGSIPEHEKKVLATLLKKSENQLYLASQIDNAFLDPSLNIEVDEEIGNELLRRIRQTLHEKDLPLEYTEVSHGAGTPVLNVWYRRNGFRYIAGAAAIVIIIATGVLMNNQKLAEPPVAVQNNTTPETNKPHLRYEINTSGKEKSIRLADGSVVVLANNSELTYQDPFTDKRDITLVGKAYFKVATEKIKPFTVFSSAVSTTALGTEFKVIAYKNAGRLTVQLFKGKVVVKAIDKANWRMKADVRLRPGQEFVYSDQALAKVRSFTTKTAVHSEGRDDEPMADNPSLPQDARGSWYMFNNQSLGQVFDQLAFTYNVQIRYSKKDVQGKYFVGRFNKSDSLDVILKYILLVNKLKVIKKEDTYYINK